MWFYLCRKCLTATSDAASFLIPNIEDSNLTLQYLLCGIISYSRGIFRRHFDILDFLCWKLELQFVFLQCFKQGAVTLGEKNLMQKPMGMALCLCWQKTVCMYRMLYTVIVHRKSWDWSIRFTSCYISQGCLNVCFSNSLWFDPSGMMSARSDVLSFCSGMLEMCPPHRDVWEPSYQGNTIFE